MYIKNIYTGMSRSSSSKKSESSKKAFYDEVSSRVNGYRRTLKVLLMDSNNLPNTIDECKTDDDKATFKLITSMMNNVNCLKTFQSAITHSSITCIEGENYEVLENRGDVIAGQTFIEYLYDKFKDLKESQASDLKNLYMKSEYQTKISFRLGLDKFVMTQYSPNINKVMEDVFESTLGAIYVAAYTTCHKRGPAHELCFNLMKYILDVIMGNTVSITGIENYETKVKECFEVMGFPSVIDDAIEETSPTGKRYVCRVGIPVESMSDTALIKDIVKPDGTICIAYGKNKKYAKKNAAERAYQILMDNKLDINVIRRIHNTRTLGEDLYNRCMKKMEQLRYIDFKFFEPKDMKKFKTNSKGFYCILLGITSKGMSVPLLSTNKDRFIVRRALVEAFLRTDDLSVDYSMIELDKILDQD